MFDMQVALIGIKADRIHGAVDIVGQQGIAEAQERIHRIGRWTPTRFAKRMPDALSRLSNTPNRAPIRRPPDPGLVGAFSFCHRGAAPQVDQRPASRRVVSIAVGALQENPHVRQLATDHLPRQCQCAGRIKSSTVLGAA